MVDDERWMRLALGYAGEAAELGAVPVGAVVIDASGCLLAGDCNSIRSPWWHAETVAMSVAAVRLGRGRLDGCTLYSTLEPCVMCAGALVLARVDRLVFGADDPKAGAVGSVWDIPRDPRLNHRVEVTRGVLADESSALLRTFFAGRRQEAV